jgi:hypothetical protein
MTIVTESEIERYRLQLAEYPDALKALDLLEECEGDLEYAAETIAIESGESDDNNTVDDEDPNEPSWLEKLADKLRVHICTPAFKEVLSQSFSAGFSWLVAATAYQALPLTLVLIYISRRGLDKFCKDC